MPQPDQRNYTQVVNRDFLLEVALGNVNGFSTDFLVGINPSMSEGVERTIWDSDFNVTPLTANTEIFINSSDAGDTTSVIIVNGLDVNFDRVTRTATLDGQTQVSVGFFTHVQACSASIATPAGDVYIAESDTLTVGVPDTDSKVKSKIRQGFNITRNGFYMVPRAMSAITVSIRGTISAVEKAAMINTIITPFGGIPLRTISYGVSQSGLQWVIPMPVAMTNIFNQLTEVLPEKTFVEFRGDSDRNANEVFFGVDFLLRDNPI